MSGFIPELTTTVRVKVNADSLDGGISIINSHGWFDELITDLKNKKAQLEELQDPLAEAVATNLSEYQKQIISMKHVKSGMMMNSVDITPEADGIYLVGNTATSVDGFPYPLAIETGRREVTPVNAKYLHWTGPQGEVFTKHSSSVSADPFVQPSIDLSEQDVQEIVDDFIDKVMGD